MSDDTWWVTPLVSAGSFLAGMVATNWGHDRSRRVKTRTVARALRADLRRIQHDLGGLDGAAFRGSSAGRAVPPMIHPWLSASIADLADEDETLFYELAMFDRKLLEFRVAVDAYWAASVAEGVADAALHSAVEEKSNGPIGAFTVFNFKIERAQLELDLAKRSVGSTIDGMAGAHRQATEAIERLFSRLEKVANRVHPLVPWGHSETIE